MRPLCIDLFCGLGGWAEGFLAEGYQVVGFDIEQHDYGTGGYPGQLVLQDVRSLHGSQFRHAAVIVASPPCQAYSYRAMPWKRARELPPPDNTLFEACFRIQREACEAASQYVPLIVENVQGAQKWVGRARWHHGSFFLWGDVPALMPFPNTQKFNPDGTNYGQDSWFAIADSKNRGSQSLKNGNTGGGSWFPQGNGAKREGNHPRDSLAIKLHSFRFDGSGQSFQTASVKEYGGGFGWDNSPLRMGNSHSQRRKAASAMIAKIPFALAQHIARVYKPESQERIT